MTWKLNICFLKCLGNIFSKSFQKMGNSDDSMVSHWGCITKGSIYAIVDRMTLTFDLLTWKWFVTHSSLMGCISCTYAANPLNNRRAMAQTWWWWWKGVLLNCSITYSRYQNNVIVYWSPSQINCMVIWLGVIPPLGQHTISHWIQAVQIGTQSYKEIRQNLKQVQLQVYHMYYHYLVKSSCRRLLQFEIYVNISLSLLC